MNMDEMLLYADIDQINKIADNYQCQCNRHSKTDIIQTILYTILKRDSVEKHIDTLDDASFTFLQLLYLDSRNKYTIEDLYAKSKQAIDLTNTSKNKRSMVIHALKSGWVFQGIGKKYLLTYLVPEDYKKKILQAIRNNLLKKMHVTENMSFYRDEKKLLVHDLIQFLRFLSKEKVLLTSDGSIYKRQQSIILKSFSVTEEPLKKMAFRFGFGRRYNEYPDRFSLIYDYAFYHKYIVEDEKGYLYVTPKAGKWLSQTTYTSDEKDLYRFWIRLYKHPIPYLLIVVKYIDLLAYRLWVNTDHLKDNLLFWIKDYYYEKKEEIFLSKILKIMLHMGIIQIGNMEGSTYVRVTEEGHKWINGYTNFDVKEIVIKK